MSVTYAELLAFLEEDLAVNTSDITPETLLFSDGLIDSFSLVSLMTYLEREGGFLIAPTEVNLENFDSLSRILAYCAGKAA